jgi:glutaminyl-peptide cyclotransferase
MKKIHLSLLAFVAIFIVSAMLWTGCKNDSESATTATSLKKAPAFNADQAYTDIQTQLAFGPRVPGTKSQQDCAIWMEAELRKTCANVFIQKVEVTQPGSGKKFPCINLIGEINPTAKSRVLLLCHWDSRGMADQEADKKNHSKAIDAADDGASGVAVLLEIARAIKKQSLDIGVDILLADVEDMGKNEYEQQGQESSYCLGTRYWAQNLHKPGYKANYGICLDMVGAKDAQFLLEANSKAVAPEVQTKIWNMASQLGYGKYFNFIDGGGITDDHVEVIRFAKIPCVDIINTPTLTTTGFASHWHTLNDNINVIDKNTLSAVGNTVLGVLYNY